MTNDGDTTTKAAHDAAAGDNPGVVLPRFGGTETLELRDLPRPQAVDDEVVVRVAAASVNPVDYKTRSGKFAPIAEADLPVVLGRDLAGTIETCGTRAHNMLRHGDRVVAFIGFDRGAQARYVVVKAVELVGLPDSIDTVTAAAIPLAAMTAWQGLFDHGGLDAGQRVLIHGAAGGVGAFAVQLAKWKGAEVFATAGAEDLDYVAGLGADTVIDHRAERFEEVARDVDVVFDLVDGETRARSWGTLRTGGILVSTVSDPDRSTAAARNVRAAPRWIAEPNAAQLGRIIDLVATGILRVEVAATYPLDRVADAHAKLEHEHVRGKIVLTLD